jgi:hypothetical protein
MQYLEGTAEFRLQRKLSHCGPKVCGIRKNVSILTGSSMER